MVLPSCPASAPAMMVAPPAPASPGVGGVIDASKPELKSVGRYFAFEENTELLMQPPPPFRGSECPLLLYYWLYG
jgi:hypothetical protein